jgi:hypothetical protein
VDSSFDFVFTANAQADAANKELRTANMSHELRTILRRTENQKEKNKNLLSGKSMLTPLESTKRRQNRRQISTFFTASMSPNGPFRPQNALTGNPCPANSSNPTYSALPQPSEFG